MAARYDFRKAPNPQGGDGVLYPRLVSNGTIPWETIVDEIAQDSSFDPGTIMGVMHEVEHRVLRHMSDGFQTWRDEQKDSYDELAKAVDSLSKTVKDWVKAEETRARTAKEAADAQQRLSSTSLPGGKA